MDANDATADDKVTDAALALIAASQAGYITIPGNVSDYQRNEIERELRVDAQILRGVPAVDQRTIAANIVGNIRHGLATGALVATRDDVAAHVQATIRSVKSALDDMRIAPSVWFDAPHEIAGGIT